MRESTWPGVELTQAQLAAGLSTEKPVGPATISTWESATSPKTPNTQRLRGYARFFSTRRSIDGDPRLIPEDELTEPEHEEYLRREAELLALAGGDPACAETDAVPPDPVPTTPGTAGLRPGSLTFSEGPVTIICPKAPSAYQGTMANVKDPNFTKLLQYADQDALIELHGHVRAANPTLDVYHLLATEAKSDDISTHVIALGGIAWNEVARQFQEDIEQVPISQVETPGLTRDPFSVELNGATEVFDCRWEGEDNVRVLSEDVAFLARLPNPYNVNRTLTICNGIHSRGVFGAVRCLTDARVRNANEDYLATRFPSGRFALLLRVHIFKSTNETMSPDLQNPRTRLFEWPPEESARA
jgi:hypothetical protein